MNAPLANSHACVDESDDPESVLLEFHVSLIRCFFISMYAVYNTDANCTTFLEITNSK